ncbi:M20 metallopeptidase family protein [Phytoactinopolyspora halotolerans]|uniref:Amidohydrolase n=1 Tax=Phytoactinopolyspora halotolerans TaxID=1981512 RepID=A0A6L9S9L7_9ACTN|nr:amidohydrolase [Phytoactinopolyspora halotolerans]NEE01324.1 amidohydrolase [Phytoactinopolyspora halotolerans]
MVPSLDQRLIDIAASAIDSDLVELRRAIHRYPERAGPERENAALVAGRLRDAGLDVRAGVSGHGVVAVVHGSEPGPLIAYRADMDAVRDDELFDSDIRSRVPGVAHLCGHDIHTAVGVGVAETLAALRDRFHGSVAFLFQPAEETLDGARAMIDEGVLDDLQPVEIYAIHCGPTPAGTISVLPGVGQPGHDGFHVDMTGPGAAERAHEIRAAVLKLATLPPLHELGRDGLERITEPDGPFARFVVARSWVESASDDGARLNAMFRAWPQERYAELRQQSADIVTTVCGTEIAERIVFWGEPFPAMVCDAKLSEQAGEYFGSVLGPENISVLRGFFPYNGEDFALFLDRIPGAMFYLGVSNESAGQLGVPHAPTFSADESAIGIGTRAVAGWLGSRLGP